MSYQKNVLKEEERSSQSVNTALAASRDKCMLKQGKGHITALALPLDKCILQQRKIVDTVLAASHDICMPDARGNGTSHGFAEYGSIRMPRLIDAQSKGVGLKFLNMVLAASCIHF